MNILCIYIKCIFFKEMGAKFDLSLLFAKS